MQRARKWKLNNEWVFEVYRQIPDGADFQVRLQNVDDRDAGFARALARIIGLWFSRGGTGRGH